MKCTEDHVRNIKRSYDDMARLQKLTSYSAYDGAGRAYQTRTVLDLESTKYSSGKFQYRAPTPHPTVVPLTEIFANRGAEIGG